MAPPIMLARMDNDIPLPQSSIVTAEEEDIVCVVPGGVDSLGANLGNGNLLLSIALLCF